MPPVPVATPATQAPELATVEKVAIAPPTVQAYAPKAKARLSLPKAVQQDPAQHVVAATRVPADDRPRTVITTLDETTGAVASYERMEPLPWLAPETSGEIGISYGLRGDGHGVKPVGRVVLRQNLLQIKAARLGLNANLDQDGQWFAGVGVWYRW